MPKIETDSATKKFDVESDVWSDWLLHTRHADDPAYGQIVQSVVDTSWEVFLQTSPHPWAPSLRQILAAQFSDDERRFFEQMVRQTVESGQNATIERAVYMQAQKPL